MSGENQVWRELAYYHYGKVNSKLLHVSLKLLKVYCTIDHFYFRLMLK